MNSLQRFFIATKYINTQLRIIALGVLAIQPTWASPLSIDAKLLLEGRVPLEKREVSDKIGRLLFAQQPNSTVPITITGVKINSTASGIEVILQTTLGSKLQVVDKSDTKSFTVDILNAQLQLPNGNQFQQEKPIAGIAEVTVSNQNANTIRLMVMGETTAPKAELFDGDEGLIFGFTPVASTTQQPQTQPTPAPQPPATQEKPSEKPQADTNNDPIELVVTGEQDRYRVPESSTATKIEVPIRDIPQSIQVIPRQVIEDRKVTRLSELTDNVSGVQRQSGYGGLSSTTYYIRGFDSSESLRNGFKDFAFTSPRDTANIERVEFLKGPASVLYGAGSTLGGIVNTITKKPLTEPFYKISMTAGNFNFYRPEIDLTGPLTDDKSLLYRLNLAYENANSFRDGVENESIFVSPVITWNISQNTTLTAELEYQKYDYTFDRGFFPDPIVFKLPVSRLLLGEPDYSRNEVESLAFNYNFEHKFSEQWKIRQGFSLLEVNSNTKEVTLANFASPFLDVDGRTLQRKASESNGPQENYSLQNELSGKFNTGSVRHNVLVGLELSRSLFGYQFFNAPIASIDIFDPKYGAKPRREDFVPSYSPEEYGANTVALYLQDLIEITPNLKLLAGGRFDWVDSFYRNEDRTTDLEQSDFRFSPRIGLVYQPSNSTSLYASWSNSFSPEIFSRNRTGEPFKPTIGEQIEVGIKQDFLDNRLSATLALYQLTKQNVLTTDPEDPDFSIQSGEQKSRGIELDIAGEILPGWRLIATYAYTDAFVSKDNLLPVGDRLVNIPYNSASLWTTYEFQKGSLQGFGFGLGAVYAGEREVQLPNTRTKLPSYIRADAALFYRLNNYKFGLNFKNLFSTKYYDTQGFFITPNAPFTVLGSVSVEF
ncbi:ligand-gated channel [Calothrix sp. HK-06]|nr:ligand-gated channel [Calothrix sp. HK-06]